MNAPRDAVVGWWALMLRWRVCWHTAVCTHMAIADGTGGYGTKPHGLAKWQW